MKKNILLTYFLLLLVINNSYSQNDSSKTQIWSITKQTAKVNGKNLNYNSTAGYMILKDESGKAKIGRAHV